MSKLRLFSTRIRFNFDAEAALQYSLFAIMTGSYVLVVFALVVAVVVLPFGDAKEVLQPPRWLYSWVAVNSLLSAIATILFGQISGASVIATLIVLLTLPRVSRWLRIRINELVYGQHDDAFEILTQMNPKLQASGTPGSLLSTIAGTIAQTLKLPYVAIETQISGTPFTTTFGTPPQGAEIETLPLLYQEMRIGELRVAARRRDEPLSDADLRVLGDLVRQVGIALYAAQLTDELQRARVRLVAAREEERRRIRRNLHDGLGPTLASLAMQLEQAREKLPPGAQESDMILARLTAQTQATIADIRRLVYDLRPPDLDEYGLRSALQEYLHRMQPRDSTIRLDAPERLPALPAAVEVAVYRIVQEAVNNALKYAQANEIRVILGFGSETAHPSWLRVEIVDNGVGLAVDHPVGIGLHSMRERAEELGGSWAIRRLEKGGTEVVAHLPVEF